MNCQKKKKKWGKRALVSGISVALKRHTNRETTQFDLFNCMMTNVVLSFYLMASHLFSIFV